MTIPSDEEIQRIIDKWRKILGLDDWDIQWCWNDGLAHDAQVRVYYSERRMRMTFNCSILDYPDREREETILHELLHSFTQPIDNFIRPFIEEFLPPCTFMPFWRGYNDVADNTVVDNLVRLLMKAK